MTAPMWTVYLMAFCLWLLVVAWVWHIYDDWKRRTPRR